MVRAARAAGAQVLLVGMRMPPNYGRSYTQEFEAMFVALAKTEGAALVPCSAGRAWPIRPRRRRCSRTTASTPTRARTRSSSTTCGPVLRTQLKP
jgi:hypothetical protein